MQPFLYKNTLYKYELKKKEEKQMIKVIIISKNHDFVQQVINNMRNHSIDIEISEVADSLEKVGEINQEISLIFLDQENLKQSQEKWYEKYHDRIIVTSTKEIENETKIMAIKNLQQTLKPEEIAKIRNQIIHEMEYIGYNFKLNGAHYLADVILHIYQNKKQMVDSLEKDIYPIIARKYGKQVNNIKNSIANASKCMYCACDIEKLKNYFNLYEDIQPNIKQIIFTVIQKVEMLEK